MMPRDYFGGLFRIKAYDYWWGYSAAQIELMAVDIPLVVYGKKKKFVKPRPEAVEAASKRWHERYGEGQQGKIDVRSILAGRV